MDAHSYRLPDFVREVNARFRFSHPETLWSCTETLYRYLRGGGIDEFLAHQLQQLRSNPHFLGDWAAQEIVIHREPAWTLSIAILDAPRRYIHALSELACYVPLDGDGLAADRYALPPGYRNEVFDPAITLEKAGEVSARQGEILALETDRYAYDFRIRQATPILRLMTAPLKPLEWLFSKATLQAWQANDADISSTQLRVAAYVLGKIAHQSSVTPLKNLAAHPHHAVRWAAIQNLGRLNRSEALVKIREATKDPHPHVRRAAQKTLDQLEKKPAPAA